MPGPEFVTEENCIFVGMVSDDVDVSELVETICTLGRDVEESGRVTSSVGQSVFLYINRLRPSADSPHILSRS